MRTSGILRPAITGIVLGAASVAALAAPVTYNVDSNHTYPTFEADHLGGLSYWRGKINSTSGTVTLDKEAQSGTVNVTMDMKTIDFGHQGLNDHAQTPDLFDTAQFPTATYTGRLTNFRNGSPTAVEGELTMHGVTKPVTLTINKFTCKEHPMQKREVCGADASATLNRADFGVNFGQQMGFGMDVTLRISIEAIVPPSS
ncbi:MAG TPA: YceI family protein [Gammaproteobacteria bacterium]|jgi:polyisoprenoid-binding protein YceI